MLMSLTRSFPFALRMLKCIIANQIVTVSSYGAINKFIVVSIRFYDISLYKYFLLINIG